MLHPGVLNRVHLELRGVLHPLVLQFHMRVKSGIRQVHLVTLRALKNAAVRVLLGPSPALVQIAPHSI